MIVSWRDNDGGGLSVFSRCGLWSAFLLLRLSHEDSEMSTVRCLAFLRLCNTKPPSRQYRCSQAERRQPPTFCKKKPTIWSLVLQSPKSTASEAERVLIMPRRGAPYFRWRVAASITQSSFSSLLRFIICRQHIPHCLCTPGAIFCHRKGRIIVA